MRLFDNVTDAWLRRLQEVLAEGTEAAPRGKKTLEILHVTTRVALNRPVVLVPDRRLNYSFMAAEALWVAAGSDRLADLLPWNQRMAEFSDDGETLAGAYGPKVVAQFDYVATTLLRDPTSRQAVLSLWERNPSPSKDIPCTLALQFMIRDGRLDAHVFMRSSDVWLGLPYDLFTFAMVAVKLACRLNMTGQFNNDVVRLGDLYLTAASSHLYAEHRAAAELIVASAPPVIDYKDRDVPSTLIIRGDWAALVVELERCRDKAALTSWKIRP